MLDSHVEETRTIPSDQSAYHRHHSTYTALTIVVSDILMAADTGDVSALALLDFDAAFDMVDHCHLRHLCGC